MKKINPNKLLLNIERRLYDAYETKIIAKKKYQYVMFDETYYEGICDELLDILSEYYCEELLENIDGNLLNIEEKLVAKYEKDKNGDWIVR